MKCNKEKCTCPHVDCKNHGNCCACVNSHIERKVPVYCMKELVKG